MKHKLLILTMLAGLFAGCTENQWMDWKVQNDLWLEQNIINHEGDSSFFVLSDGLQYRVIADPTPKESRPNATSTIVCDYTGKLINGYEFDRSVKDGSQFSMSNLVSGFSEALRKIHQNGDIEIYVPYYLGYDESKISSGETNKAEGNGTEGTQSYIPPYSVMIFTVHLKSVAN